MRKVFNFRYMLATAIVSFLMLGYNWGFNMIYHNQKVFVFQEAVKILYGMRQNELRYSHLGWLDGKVKCYYFRISCPRRETFDTIVLANGWERFQMQGKHGVYKKNNYTLDYMFENSEIICDISYRGVPNDD